MPSVVTAQAQAPPIVTAQASPAANVGRVVVKDDDLNLFLNGQLPDPEDRVSRRGVRSSRAPGEAWKSTKPKIFQLARIKVKARKFEYKYTPIKGNQIRLLRIRPGKPTTKISCDLCVKDLADVKGKYEALSYCWGIEEPTEAIYIYRLKRADSGPDHELLEEEEFPVRPNLLKALRHLRREDKGVIIWVDAICINQRESSEATTEKNRQLSMMSEIYNSAKNVCIWLGDGSQTSTSALRLVTDITNFQVLDKQLAATGKTECDELTASRWCDFIRTLRESAWFSRRWIIQEIASARHASIHCGNDVVHWDDLSDAISLLQENYEVLRRQFEKFDNDTLFTEVPTLSATQLVKALANVCRKTSTGEIVERLLDLETLVCTFQQFQARYPQDVIHSVRALAMDAPGGNEADGLGLGGEQKKSTRDLFVAFVKRCITQSGSLDIICRHWAPPITDTAGQAIALPTWISELSNAPFGLPGEYNERQNGENFVAMLSTDRRKRYNASLDWGRVKKSSTDLVTKARPAISIPNSINIRSRLHLGAEFTASPSASPALEKGDQFQSLVQEPAGIASNEPRPKTPLQNSAISGAERPPSVPENHSVDHINTLHPLPTEITVENPEGVKAAPENSRKRPHGPEGPSPFRRRRSYTASKPNLPEPNSPVQTPTSRKVNQLWDVVADAAMFPGGLRPQNVKRVSRSRQDTWTFDKEHDHVMSGFLSVRGFVLGNVLECSDIMRDGIISGRWLTKLGWVRSSHHNRVPDVLWRTLVADRNPDGGSPPGWYQRACLHCLEDPRLTNMTGDLNSHKLHKVSESMTSMYLKRVESVVWRRRIIEVAPTAKANGDLLYGLAPEKTRATDIVCILVGCSVPVVLRKAESGAQGFFELIGEAYIHGKMDGEAVQSRPPEDPQETFWLQ